jgi:hypothetical protein
VKNEDQPVGRTRKPMAGPIYAHDSEAQTVTKNFEAAIPNIAGKSPIYAYVISGAIGSRVNDGETRI